MRDLIADFAHHLDLHQSPYHARVMQKIGWQIDGEPGHQLFYRPFGPLTIAKYQRPVSIDPDRLKHFRQAHHTLTTYVEPPLLSPYNLGNTVEPFAHSTSALIDLSPSEKTLLSGFSQKTRYNITHQQKKSLLKLTSTPLPNLTMTQKQTFFALHAEWSKRKNVIGYSRDLLGAVLSSFDQDSYLHFAYDIHGDAQAALLTLASDHVSTYYAAFSSTTGYALYAPTLLTYQAFETAKSIGCDIFDFGGIYDPRYPRMYKKWGGFTKFKAGFHPTTIQYPPTKLHLFW